MTKPQAVRFRQRLLPWYDLHQRDLPWRRTRDPYRIWVSEIMLQQTRVNAVLAHYQRFLKQFPSVENLASAPLSSVLAAWSGLGYYRRARMLQAAAKEVVRSRDGALPSTTDELRALPGIGRYTAAAIASIAFGAPAAVVDGNVERVLQRLAGRKLSQPELWEHAQSLLDPASPGDFNQAMMELGATVCLPEAPACGACPVARFCATRGDLALSARKPRQQKQQIHYTLACGEKSVFLVKRSADASLMAGMWELPESRNGARRSKAHYRLRHSITVTNYTVLVRRQAVPRNVPGIWAPLSRLDSLPLTGLARKILRVAGVLSGHGGIEK